MSDQSNLVMVLPNKRPPVQDVVEALERLLEEARNGELRGCAFAYVKSPPSRSVTGWVGDASKEDLTYSVTLLHSRIMRANLEIMDGECK